MKFKNVRETQNFFLGGVNSPDKGGRGVPLSPDEGSLNSLLKGE